MHRRHGLLRTLFISLIWWMAALLPLRGGAHVGLMLNTAAHTGMAAAATATSDPLSDHAVDLPCHESAATGSTDATATDPTRTTAGHCSTCDACHASLAPAPAHTLLWDTLPTAAPTPAPDTGLPPGVVRGLYRPPRAPHA